MAESATLGNPAVQTEPDVVATWQLGEILRDIARGGIAGLAVGIVVGGLGGRVAMRLIALLIPEATGLLHGERQPDRRHHPRRELRVDRVRRPVRRDLPRP